MTPSFARFSVGRALSQFAGASVLLILLGTLLFALELVVIFGASLLKAVSDATAGGTSKAPNLTTILGFVGKIPGIVDEVQGMIAGSIGLAFVVNVVLLPLIGALTAFGIGWLMTKKPCPDRRNFLLGLLLGAVVYAVYFVICDVMATHPHAVFVLTTHLWCWLLMALVQTVAMQV